jgi:hypothetical protein
VSAQTHKTRYNLELKFHYNSVEFGLEDDEVVVAAILIGSNDIVKVFFLVL